MQRGGEQRAERDRERELRQRAQQQARRHRARVERLGAERERRELDGAAEEHDDGDVGHHRHAEHRLRERAVGARLGDDGDRRRRRARDRDHAAEQGDHRLQRRVVGRRRARQQQQIRAADHQRRRHAQRDDGRADRARVRAQRLRIELAARGDGDQREAGVVQRGRDGLHGRRRRNSEASARRAENCASYEVERDQRDAEALAERRHRRRRRAVGGVGGDAPTFARALDFGRLHRGRQPFSFRAPRLASRQAHELPQRWSRRPAPRCATR